MADWAAGGFWRDLEDGTRELNVVGYIRLSAVPTVSVNPTTSATGEPTGKWHLEAGATYVLEGSYDTPAAALAAARDLLGVPDDPA